MTYRSVISTWLTLSTPNTNARHAERILKALLCSVKNVESYSSILDVLSSIRNTSVQKLIKCEDPYEEIKVESEKEMKKAMIDGNDGEGMRGDVRGSTSNTSKPSAADMRMDWLVRAVKEMKEEVACKSDIKAMFRNELEETKKEFKNEVKSMIREIVKHELEEIKQELKILEKNVLGRVGETKGNALKSFADAVIGKKKESVIVVKPKNHQESETTKKVVKEKINITDMAVGITKLKKGNKGNVILGCESKSEMEKLKVTVQNKLGEDYNIMEPKGAKSKIKTVNIEEEEIKLDDEKLLYAIIKQNKIEDEREEFHMRIIKKIAKENTRGGENNGSLIIELDDVTYDELMKRGKINVGWRKCRVFDYISVKRCFKCWGYYHIAKNCVKQESCHKCAGKHKAEECREKKMRCVNCMHKIKTYNLKINDEHDALSRECPTYLKALEEEKKRTGKKDTE